MAPKQKSLVAHTWLGDDGPAPSPAALQNWAKQNPGAHFLPDDVEDLNVPGFAQRGEMAERPEPGDRPGQQQAEQQHDVQFTKQHQAMLQPQHKPMPQGGKPKFKPFKPR